MRDFKQLLKRSAKDTIPTKETTRKQDDISTETLGLIQKRSKQNWIGNVEEAHRLIKEIRKQRKKDKRKATIDAISKDIDLRDRWLGLRQLKKGFQINPYAVKD